MSRPAPHHLRRRGLVLAAAGALVVGACAQEASDPAGIDSGSGGLVAGGEPDLGSAIDATRSAESAAVVLSLEVSSSIGGGTIELDGDLSRDDVGTIVATGDGDGEHYELEMLADGDSVWITSDADVFVDALPAGATWVEGSIDDLRDDDLWSGLDTTFDILSVLRGVDGLTEAGTTEVGGDEVRLFEGDVDWEAALDASDPEERAALEETITLTGDTELQAFTVEVGLDDENRVRVMEIEVVAGPPADADDMPFLDEITMRLGLEVESIDHEVEVPDAPSADETVPLSEVPEVAEMLVDGF